MTCTDGADWLRTVVHLPLSLLAFIGAALTAGHGGGQEARLQRGLFLLDWNTHVASISSLAAIALVLADTLVCAKAGIFATLARALTVTTLLALSASLAARLGREILFVLTELILEVQGGCIGGLARLWRH